MTTITINNSNILSRYSNNELKGKFIDFLQNEIKEEKVNLYSVSVDGMADSVKKSYQSIDKMNFVN